MIQFHERLSKGEVYEVLNETNVKTEIQTKHVS